MIDPVIEALTRSNIGVGSSIPDTFDRAIRAMINSAALPNVALSRFYQALEAAGQDAKLDVYEGMWHVFQTAPSPETEVSLQKIKMFFNKHLGI